jgi:hypothetical protein
MRKKKTNKEYGYKPVTVLFDLNVAEEKQLFDWLSGLRKKNCGYCSIMKKALAEMMERENNIRAP